MSLMQKIQEDSVQAMKSGNKVESDILKIVLAALKNARIAKGGGEELNDQEEVKVVFAEAKKVKDSIENFEKAGRDDLVAREKEQLTVVERYLPEQMSEEDVQKVVKKVIDEMGASSMAQMGMVMGASMKELQGKADGALVNKVVKELLS